MNKFNEIISQWEVPRAQTKEAAWESLQQKIDLKDSQQSRKVVPMWKRLAIPLAAAASIALLLWVVLAPNTQMVNHVTFAGEHTSVDLPDGSTAVLNAASEIQYDKNNWEEQREVTLLGEAFFEVKKGSSFQVKTQRGEVEVLGTSFNVFQRGDELEVACYSGEVAVECELGKEKLTTGKMVKSSGESMELITFEPETGDWRTGHYSFEGVSLDRVLDEVALQYNMDIKYGDLSDRTFYGSFTVTEENDEETLAIICKAMGMEYDFVDSRTVVVKGK